VGFVKKRAAQPLVFKARYLSFNCVQRQEEMAPKKENPADAGFFLRLGIARVERRLRPARTRAVKTAARAVRFND
jgi:hypothetical protein